MRWTSIADLRAVSITGVLLFSGAMVCSRYLSWPPLRFEEYKAGPPILILAILFLATFYFSKVVTNRHRNLGDEQCEYILTHYKDDLKSQLTQAMRLRTTLK